MSSKFMRGSSLLVGDNTVPGVRLPEDLKELLPRIFQEVRDFGCDYYDTVVQMLTYDEISEVAAYGGFPVRYPHWKWGMEYEELQRGYLHGMHRIYEMVVNCCGLDTTILSKRGRITAGEVQVGDFIMGPSGWRKVVLRENQKPSKVRELSFQGMYTKTICTPNHKWKCYRDGKSEWIEAKDIVPGDVIFAGTDYNNYLNSPSKLEWSESKVYFDTRPNVRNRLIKINPPKEMTLSLAELMGAISGDGSQGVRLADNLISVCVSKNLKDYQQRLIGLFEDSFGIEPYVNEEKESVDVICLSSKYAVDFMNEIGLKKGCTYKTKRVPWSIWSSSNEYRAAFLRGVFDANGYCGKYLSLICYSDEFAADVQQLLLEMGIRSEYKKISNDHNKITILGGEGKSNIRKFNKYIGFSIKYKQDALNELSKRDGRSDILSMPGMMGVIQERIASIQERIASIEDVPHWMYSYGKKKNLDYSNSNSFYDFVCKAISEGYEEQFGDIIKLLEIPTYVVESNNELSELVETVDIALDHNDHDFLANGLWSHNTNPCYIYCLDSNTLVDHVTVVAHALGHCDFFKNNVFFSQTSQNMMNKLANHGTRIRKYMTRWGKERVMEFIDHVLRIETLIDPAKAWDRKIVKEPVIVDKRDWKHPERLKVREGHDHMDEYLNPKEWIDDQQEEIERGEAATELSLFREPTKDILGFIRDNAPLKPWQADIVSMIHEESMYFAPQRQTKMLNEGWASFIDYNIMARRGLVGLGQEGYDCGIIEYAKHKMGVLGGKYSLNPYKLGFCLFLDIEERWNKGQFGKDYEECKDIYEKEHWDTKNNLGHEKVFEVRRNYNDLTALIEFFTPEFCNKYEFFEWKKYPNGETKLESRDYKKIKNKLISRYLNGGLPEIRLSDPNHRGKGQLFLEHVKSDKPLFDKYVRPVLQSLYFLWGQDVFLSTRDRDDEEIIYQCIGTKDDDVGLFTREEYEKDVYRDF